MNIRPRCRDWEPLLTNQLRLRNVLQIKVFNVECHPRSHLYFTLHHTSMSSPFYTSERLEPQSMLVEWPEINSEQVLTSASRSVCVRIWEHLDSASNSNKSNKLSSNNKTDDAKRVDCDKILFMWGVYFSGLIQIPKHCDIKLCKNTLIFSMNGGSFTSSNYILDQNEIANLSEVHETNSIPDEKSISRKSDCDSNPSLDNNSYNSNSNTNVFKTQLDQDHDNRRSHSSINSLNLMKDWETVNFPINNQITHILNESGFYKVRYVQLDFFNTEIRPSYNVEKLLKLQEIQRIKKRRTKDSKILIDRICMKSAFCLNLELISNKAIFYEPPKRSTMGRTLDRILAETQFKPKPEDLLKAQELRRKIEIVKSRLRLLYEERERQRMKIRKLKEVKETLKDEALESDSITLSGYYELRKEKDKLYQDKLTIAGQKEMLVNVKNALRETRRTLLTELNDIYCVRKNERGQFTINGIYLPDAESYTPEISDKDASVALGFVAHAVIICSTITNVPMRSVTQLILDLDSQH